MAGTSRSGEVQLTFENLPVLLKNLTPARWKQLEAAKRSGPMSINELARLLGRNYKNVHTDVTRLIKLGLIERIQDQRIAVGWDTITAENEAGCVSGRSVGEQVAAYWQTCADGGATGHPGSDSAGAVPNLPCR